MCINKLILFFSIIILIITIKLNNLSNEINRLEKFEITNMDAQAQQSLTSLLQNGDATLKNINCTQNLNVSGNINATSIGVGGSNLMDYINNKYNDAINKANNAQNTANDAVNRANNAQTSANNANNNANGRQPSGDYIRNGDRLAFKCGCHSLWFRHKNGGGVDFWKDHPGDPAKFYMQRA